MTMLYVFKSATHPHTPGGLSKATHELNEALDVYLRDKPGLLVAGMGSLYFHVESGPAFVAPDTFTLFLPVMFAQSAEEEDD
jgi:hypothetical protein